MSRTFRVRPALPSDLGWGRRLLGEAGLPDAGLPDQFPAAYAVLEEDGRPIGLAGLEHYGGAGLLRSVAIAPGVRGGGAGRVLVEDRLARARGSGIGAVYLLTTTAAEWFTRFGFSPISRTDIPPELGRAPEVAEGCPATATVMRLRL